MNYSDEEIRAMLIAQKKKERSRQNDKEALTALAFGALLPLWWVLSYAICM